MPYIPEADTKHCHRTQWLVEGEVCVGKADQNLHIRATSQERFFDLVKSVELDECQVLNYLKNKKPTRCHLLFYCTSYKLNMFRALLCPSSGARDCNVDYHIGRLVLGLL